MSRFSIPLRSPQPVAAALLLLLGGGAALFLALPLAGAADLQFLTPRTVLWLGRSQVIPVRMATASGDDQTRPARIADAAIAEVLRPPAVLAGETIGYLRARGLHTGVTRLTMGTASIEVEVRPDPAGALPDETTRESHQPRIVSPMPGAAVWGQFVIGVDMFDNDPRAESQDSFDAGGAPPATASVWKVQLRLPGGQLIDPIEQTTTDLDPCRRYVFSVRAEELRPGRARFAAVATPSGLNDIDRRAGRGPLPAESEAVTFNVQEPADDALWKGECENVLVPSSSPAPGRAAANAPMRQGNIVTDAGASGGQALSGTENGPVWRLPFTVAAAGNYQLLVQARGDFAAGAYPTAALSINGSERPAGLVRLVSAKYHRLPIGAPVHLDAGPQVLSVNVENAFHHGNQDRNIFLDRYELARIPDDAPAAARAPRAGAPALMPRLAAPSGLAAGPAPAVSAERSRLAVLYPADGAKVYGADAVVVQPPAGASLAWIDLVIDDDPVGLRVRVPVGGAPLPVPLLTRGLMPGAHLLAVRAVDTMGNQIDSPIRIFELLEQAPAERGVYERAVRLLNRFAFGPEPGELAALLAMGERRWLQARLAGGAETPGEQEVLRAASARYPDADDATQTVCRVLYQAVAAENPVRARFTLWAENHFSTWIEKTGAGPKWREHLEFSRLGIAPFGDLLAASAHSPAMLVYLDQERSFAGTLNENYAREVMELHTLGVHGGYRQTDVTSLAGLLNGWTLAKEAALPDPAAMSAPADGAMSMGAMKISADFHFAPALNDGKPHRIFGIEFPAAVAPASRYDRARLALEMLAAHPSTAEHICRKLAEHYVSTPAPDALVNDLSRVFLETGGDLRAVLRAMAAHPAFWEAPPKLATPLDFALRLARLFRAASVPAAGPAQGLPPEQIAAFLKKSGMGLFDRVTPDGYPDSGASYADSNALLQRWRFTQTLGAPLDTLVPGDWRQPAPGLAQRFIDLAAIRLTGSPLSASSNQAALGILGEPTPERMRDAMIFVGLLPEANLR